MAAAMFASAFAAVNFWDAERKLHKFETIQSSYNMFSYLFEKTSNKWPVEMFVSLTLFEIAFFMIGMINSDLKN